MYEGAKSTYTSKVKSIHKSNGKRRKLKQNKIYFFAYFVIT